MRCAQPIFTTSFLNRRQVFGHQYGRCLQRSVLTRSHTLLAHRHPQVFDHQYGAQAAATVQDGAEVVEGIANMG